MGWCFLIMFPSSLILLSKRSFLFSVLNVSWLILICIFNLCSPPSPPKVMAVSESSRLSSSLKKESVPVKRLIVNQMLPPSASDCKFCSMKRKVLLVHAPVCLNCLNNPCSGYNGGEGMFHWNLSYLGNLPLKIPRNSSFWI